MPSLDVEFEVFCATCGAGLCNVTNVRSRHPRSPAVEVERCERCADTAKEEGYLQGATETAAEYEMKLAELQKRIDYLESLEQEVA